MCLAAPTRAGGGGGRTKKKLPSGSTSGHPQVFAIETGGATTQTQCREGGRDPPSLQMGVLLRVSPGPRRTRWASNLHIYSTKSRGGQLTNSSGPRETDPERERRSTCSRWENPLQESPQHCGDHREDRLLLLLKEQCCHRVFHASHFQVAHNAQVYKIQGQEAVSHKCRFDPDSCVHYFVPALELRLSLSVPNQFHNFT